MGILPSRLNNWYEENNVLDESQADFRQKYITIVNVFNLMAVVKNYLTTKRGRSIVHSLTFKMPLITCNTRSLWKEITLSANSSN